MENKCEINESDAKLAAVVLRNAAERMETSAINNAINRCGVNLENEYATTPSKRDASPLSEEEITTINNMYQNGAKIRVICKALNRAYGSVYYHIKTKSNNLSNQTAVIPKQPRKRRDWASLSEDDKLMRIVRLHEAFIEKNKDRIAAAKLRCGDGKV